MSTSRQYELVYIVSPDASEQEVTDLHTQVETQIARIGGELVKSENWGRRKMAYEIGPHKEGVYVLELINGWPKTRRWTMRTRVGTRKKWYRLPEEVAHGSTAGGG